MKNRQKNLVTIFKKKLISSLISEQYFLQDIYHHLQRNEKLKT